MTEEAVDRMAAMRAAKAKKAEDMKAAEEAAPALPPGYVWARVLKKGHDKISTGEHIGGQGEQHHPFGTIFQVEQAIAEDLEERGYAEIQ